MLDLKGLDRNKAVNLIVSALTGVVMLVAMITMLVSKRFLRLTIGPDFVIRWLLVFAVGLAFIYGVVRFALCSVTKADASKAASQEFIFFGLGELCAIAICILTFFGEADYQQNMNLIEDLLGIVFHLILCVFALFGVAFARSRKRAFIVSVIAGAVALLIAVIEIAFVGPAAVRAQSMDFTVVISSIGSIMPYAAAAVFSKTMLAEDGEKISENTEDGENV